MLHQQKIAMFRTRVVEVDSVDSLERAVMDSAANRQARMKGKHGERQIILVKSGTYRMDPSFCQKFWPKLDRALIVGEISGPKPIFWIGHQESPRIVSQNVFINVHFTMESANIYLSLHTGRGILFLQCTFESNGAPNNVSGFTQEQKGKCLGQIMEDMFDSTVIVLDNLSFNNDLSYGSIADWRISTEQPCGFCNKKGAENLCQRCNKVVYCCDQCLVSNEQNHKTFCDYFTETNVVLLSLTPMKITRRNHLIEDRTAKKKLKDYRRKEFLIKITARDDGFGLDRSREKHFGIDMGLLRGDPNMLKKPKDLGHSSPVWKALRGEMLQQKNLLACSARPGKQE